MRTVKLHIPWPWTFEPEDFALEYLKAARVHKNIVLCDFEEADYLLYTQDTRLGPRSLARVKPGTLIEPIAKKILGNTDFKREIFLDYADWHSETRVLNETVPSKEFYRDVDLYFKRSVVNKSNNSLVNYQRKMHLLPVAARDDYVQYAAGLKPVSREYDFCCLFPVFETNETVIANRVSIPGFLSKLEYSSYIGFVQGDPNTPEFNMTAVYQTVQPDYFDVLRKSKIIVNCGPPDWEGDMRIWEALLTGNLVFSDRIFTNHLWDHPLIDKKHLVFYDNLQHLQELLEYYLNHDEERISIGQAGKDFVLSHHTYVNRLDTILDKIV